ncbi:amidohydrolase, partial [bacterium]
MIRAGRIVDITDDTSALATVGGLTRVVDLAGAVVIPGLADSHCHLQGLGKALSQIDLNDTP